MTTPKAGTNKRAKLTVYQDRRKLWRWRFVVNGRIMADSGEGYARQAGAWRAWDHFVGHITKRNYTTTLDLLKELHGAMQTLLTEARKAEAEMDAKDAKAAQ